MLCYKILRAFSSFPFPYIYVLMNDRKRIGGVIGLLAVVMGVVVGLMAVYGPQGRHGKKPTTTGVDVRRAGSMHDDDLK